MSEDYSPTIKDAARRLIKTGQHIHRMGELTRRLHEKVTPPKSDSHPDVSVPRDDGGTMRIDGYNVATWIGHIVLWARAHGWNGRVTSGYRSVADQREACRHVCGNPNGCPGTCAKPGTSNHQYTSFPRGAVDVSEYTEFGRIVARYPNGPTIKNDLPLDRVHFSYSGH